MACLTNEVGHLGQNDLEGKAIVMASLGMKRRVVAIENIFESRVHNGAYASDWSFASLDSYRGTPCRLQSLILQSDKVLPIARDEPCLFHGQGSPGVASAGRCGLGLHLTSCRWMYLKGRWTSWCEKARRVDETKNEGVCQIWEMGFGRGGVLRLLASVESGAGAAAARRSTLSVTEIQICVSSRMVCRLRGK
jgi:hypothetical protein